MLQRLWSDAERRSSEHVRVASGSGSSGVFFGRCGLKSRPETFTTASWADNESLSANMWSNKDERSCSHGKIHTSKLTGNTAELFLVLFFGSCRDHQRIQFICWSINLLLVLSTYVCRNLSIFCPKSERCHVRQKHIKSSSLEKLVANPCEKIDQEMNRWWKHQIKWAKCGLWNISTKIKETGKYLLWVSWRWTDY